MDPLIVVLRLVHIVFGIAWAGTIFFFVTMLEPSVRAAGPEGGKVMFQLFNRHYLEILPVVAGLTILAGVLLLWRVSAGFSSQWMGSRTGITFSTGALSAIVAFLVGMIGMRPLANRMLEIMRTLPTVTDDATRTALTNEMGGLRTRTRTYARAVAVFLLIAAMAMSVARYV